jgi:hypothetical protein
MKSPDTLLRVANFAVERRPGPGPKFRPDPWASPGHAARALGMPDVRGADLPGLQVLHAVVVELAGCLLAGWPTGPTAQRLTDLARLSVARVTLKTSADGSLQPTLLWLDPTPTASLARKIVFELGAMQPGRLRRCARGPCDLLFYDTTRPNTRRWHADSPCGQRERQERFHAARGGIRAEGT